jgi:hypothetical protein
MAFITFTDDTDIPKTITFGGSPLVRWYLYLRNPSRNLYIQREDNGVLGPETLILLPISPPLPDSPLNGIEDVDIVVDPSDATKAHIYFTSDGTLWRFTVTSTPIGEQPTQQVFNRQNGRFDVFRVGDNTGGNFRASGDNRQRALEFLPFSTESYRSTQLPIPTIAITLGPTSVQRTLLINVPDAKIDYNEPDALEIYRSVDGAGYTLFQTIQFSGTPRFFEVIVPADVPATVVDAWKAKTIQTPQNRTSLFSIPVFDNPIDAFRVGDNTGGNLFSPDDTASRDRWQVTTILPIKKSETDDGQFTAGDNCGGNFFASDDTASKPNTWQVITILPIKETQPDDGQFTVGDNCGGAFFAPSFDKTREFSIAGVDQGNQEFEIVGDKTFELFGGQTVTVFGSTGNDGNYNTIQVTFNGTNTVIEVAEAIPDATVDGSIRYTVEG